MAPTNSLAICPFTNALTAGMPWMRNAIDACGFASTSSLPRRNAPSCSSASRSSTGPIIRQGAHHSAQKSTTTGRRLDSSTTVSMKFWSVTSMTFGLVMVTRVATMAAGRLFPARE